MKYFHLSLLLLLCNCSYAQLIIEPLLGFNEVENELILPGFRCNGFYIDNQFRANKLFIGLNLGYQFGKYFSLSASSTYAKREDSYCDFGFIGYSAIRYEKVGLSIIPKFHIKGLFIGGGLNYNFMNNSQFGHRSRNNWHLYPPFDVRQRGWITSLGYHFKNILLEFRYSKSKTVYIDSPRNKNNYYDLQSFELMLGYRFLARLKPNKTSRKEECPKF